METRLAKIGNSHGICIPKALLWAADPGTRLRLGVIAPGLLVGSVEHSRAGWANDARRLENGLFDEPVPTAFDDSKQEWRRTDRASAMTIRSRLVRLEPPLTL